MEHLNDRELVPSGSEVLLLLPCHDTPFEAYVHREDIAVRFLDCAPPPPGSAGCLDLLELFCGICYRGDGH